MASSKADEPDGDNARDESVGPLEKLQDQLTCEVSFAALMSRKFVPAGKMTAFRVIVWKHCFGVIRGHALFLYKDASASGASRPMNSIDLAQCYINMPRKSMPKISEKKAAKEKDKEKEEKKEKEKEKEKDKRKRSLVFEPATKKEDKVFLILETSRGGWHFELETEDDRARFIEAARPHTMPVPPATRMSSKGSRHSMSGGEDSSASQVMGSVAMDKIRKKTISWFKSSKGNTKVFGVSLDEYFAGRPMLAVPLVVQKCVDEVERRGIEEKGIYRMAGVKTIIEQMKAEFDKDDEEVDLTDESKWEDVHCVSNLLKSYLRSLPECIVTSQLYDSFIEAGRMSDDTERARRIAELVQYRLPQHNFATLSVLMAHLRNVAENSEENKMQAGNLGIVFGPTLLFCADDMAMMQDSSAQCKVVETMIRFYETIFTQRLELDGLDAVASNLSVPKEPELVAATVPRSPKAPSPAPPIPAYVPKSPGPFKDGAEFRPRQTGNREHPPAEHRTSNIDRLENFNRQSLLMLQDEEPSDDEDTAGAEDGREADTGS